MTGLETPVAVVGAGPVGLVTALAFARSGVPVVVLEAAGPDVRAEWRGSTIHPPTLELLEQLDLTVAILAGCVRVERLQYRDLELGPIATFDYSALAGRTRYPFRVQFEQYKLLGLLRERASATDAVDVRYDSRVVALSQDNGRATLGVEDAIGDRYEVRARWVVAADGAHSSMRKFADIGFHGTSYPTLSLVAATRFPFDEAVVDLGPVSYWTGPRGRLSLIRTPDLWRIAVSTGADAMRPAPDAAGVHPVLREALGLLSNGSGWTAQPLEQHRFYRSHQRVASAFRAGRVLLMGDSAHLTSTTGGMGLNSGLQDASDLAARLAAPLVAGDELAEQAAATDYALSRRRVALDVQETTRNARADVDETDSRTRRIRLADLRRSAADPVARLRHLSRSSMLDSVHVVRAEGVIP